MAMIVWSVAVFYENCVKTGAQGGKKARKMHLNVRFCLSYPFARVYSVMYEAADA